MPQGKIARLTLQGYGFIMPEDSNLDPGRRGIFFHAQDLEEGPGSYGELRTGDRVEFEITDTDRGRRCVGVKVVEKNESASAQGPRPAMRKPVGEEKNPRPRRGVR
jgi:cold shock CspA family protein